MKKLIYTSLLLAIFGISAIGQICQASFNGQSSATNSVIYYFNNTSTTSNNPVNRVNYSWDFGDGGTSYKHSPSHTFSQLGWHLICLTVNEIDTISGLTNCTSTICDSVLVVPGNCNASFTNSSSQFYPLLIYFNNTSNPTNSSGATVLYNWDFGDGTFSNLPNPQNHLYNQSGSYVVCLNIIETDSNGTICTKNYCDTLSILAGTGHIPVCNAAFTVHSFPLSNQTQFSATNPSSNPYYISSYIWDFGDGVIDTASKNINHIYAQPGTYNVCLRVNTIDSVTGILECTNVTCQTTVINPVSCNAFWYVDSANSNASGIQIINTSFVGLGSSVQYHWDFGDGNTSNLAYPIHQYSSSGIYNLCLKITTINTQLDTCISTHCQMLGIDSLGNLHLKKGGPGFTLNILNPATIGLNEELLTTVKLFPNPASNYIHIDLGNSYSNNGNWSIYDLKGMKLAEGLITERNFIVDVKPLINGIYAIRINNGSFIGSHKVQIIK